MPYVCFVIWLTIVAAGAGTASWHLGGSPNDVWSIVTLIALAILVVTGLFIAQALVKKAAADRRSFLTSGLVLNGFVAPLIALAVWVIVGKNYPLNKAAVVMERGITLYAPTRITYLGKTIEEVPQLDSHSVWYRGQLGTAHHKIESMAPDGWREIRCDNDSDLKPRLKDLVILYVDNRDHPATRLDCGELHLDIPANSKQTYVIPPAIGRGDIVVMLDGVGIGVLDGLRILVDVTGVRHYRFQELVYTPFGLGAGRDKALLPDADFANKHIHSLPTMLDHFLEKAPEVKNITYRLGSGFSDDRRSELVEVE